MKNVILLFTIALFICSNCISQNRSEEGTDAGLSIQKLERIPFYHDKNGSLMLVDGIVSDSIKGVFRIDTGLTGCDMIIDSAFFFQTFDPNSFTRPKGQIKWTFYRETYEGEFPVQVGDHRFTANKVLVENIYQHSPSQEDRVVANGILGIRMFEDKMTLIDFEKRELAFADSIKIDSTYAMLEFQPSRSDSVIGKIKYVEIGGFKDENGEDIKTQFIFDSGNVVSAVAIKNEMGVNMSNPLHNKTTTTAYGHWKQPLQQIKGEVDSLTIGPYTYKNPSVSYCAQGGVLDPRSQIIGGDGLLGLGFMVRFNMIIDCKHNLLYIKPNSYLTEGAKYSWDATKDSIYLNSYETE